MHHSKSRCAPDVSVQHKLKMRRSSQQMRRSVNRQAGLCRATDCAVGFTSCSEVDLGNHLPLQLLVDGEAQVPNARDAFA